MTSATDPASVGKVLDFWFSETVEAHWFESDPEIDRQIAERFGDLQRQASAGELSGWMKNAESALALVILLDQFPRNMFRGSPRAFASDDLAREVSRVAIANAFDQQRSTTERAFFYLPLMHSEDLIDQTECVRLYRRLNDENGLDYAIQHHDIIARFGRFPHRNKVIGRENSEAELEFLKTHKGF
ncbi:MAG: hypothetical protein JWM58_604 [Rhizobium sp.]|nr:hypothetical protein [Rhizobium sp.]